MEQIDSITDDQTFADMQANFDQNWTPEGTGGRWDATNIEEGWTYEDAQAEFDDFWEENNPLEFDLEALDAEIKMVMQLIEIGVDSGKVDGLLEQVPTSRVVQDDGTYLGDRHFDTNDDGILDSEEQAR